MKEYSPVKTKNAKILLNLSLIKVIELRLNDAISTLKIIE